MTFVSLPAADATQKDSMAMEEIHPNLTKLYKNDSKPKAIISELNNYRINKWQSNQRHGTSSICPRYDIIRANNPITPWLVFEFQGTKCTIVSAKPDRTKNLPRRTPYNDHR